MISWPTRNLWRAEYLARGEVRGRRDYMDQCADYAGAAAVRADERALEIAGMRSRCTVEDASRASGPTIGR